MSGKEGKS